MTTQQIEIIQKGAIKFAQIPLHKYNRMLKDLEHAEDLEDLQLCKQHKAELEAGMVEFIPSEVVNAISEGRSPIRAWREYRGEKVYEIAKKVGIQPPFMSQIETGKKGCSLATYKAIAVALEVSIAQLDLIDEEPSAI